MYKKILFFCTDACNAEPIKLVAQIKSQQITQFELPAKMMRSAPVICSHEIDSERITIFFLMFVSVCLCAIWCCCCEIYRVVRNYRRNALDANEQGKAFRGRATNNNDRKSVRHIHCAQWLDRCISRTMKMKLDNITN